MKKFVSVVAAGALLVALCGCRTTSDFLRDNVSDDVANVFDDAVNQGSQLIENASDKLKARLAEKMTDAPKYIREAIEDKIDEMKEIDPDTPIFTTVPNQKGQGIAVLANFRDAAVVATLTEYPIGTKFPDPASESSKTFTLTIDGRKVSMLSMQCQAYARYIQVKLYGGHDGETAYQNDYVNILPEVIGSKTVAPGKLTADTLKKAVTTAGPGAHIRTEGKQHSMLIAEVSDTGFVVLEANADGKMTIAKTEYTWQDYVDGTFGGRGLAFIKVYRPN